MLHGICIKLSEYQLPSDHTIPVSSLIQAYRCPRRYYFTKNEPVQVSDRYTICKQVSLSDQNNTDEDALWDDICLINLDIKPDLREYLSLCIATNTRTPLPQWSETDLIVTSEKYGLRGLIDKYHKDAGHISIVRCTGAPATGCWPDDRVRIAAYLLCLKETTGINLSGGFIEYIPDGIVRFCEPQPRDRRGLLMALKNVRLVEKGDLPGKPVRAPCKNCRYTDRCETPKVKTLSELLFQKGK